MEEARKLSGPPERNGWPVSESEEDNSVDILYQLQALIGSAGFGLRKKVEEAKGLDEASRREMIDFMDEARDLITRSLVKGIDEEAAAEAAGYLDVLQELGEKCLPDFVKQLDDYNNRQIAKTKNPMPKLVVNNTAEAQNDALVGAGDVGREEAPAAEKTEVEEDDFRGESSLFSRQARRFDDVRKAGSFDGKNLGKAAGQRGGGRDKEPPGGDLEKLTEELDAAYKSLYGFLNDGKPVPDDLYDLLGRKEKELFNLVASRNEVAKLAESLKKKYKKPDKKETSKDESRAGKEVEKPADKDKILSERAAAVKQRRLDGRVPGFTWAEIDDLLRKNNLQPLTPAADEFMSKWDRKVAQSELRREAATVKEKPGRDYLRITPAQKAEEPEAEKNRERDLARLGTEITLSKITDYQELWAETESAGDEIFKQKTRELWREFAVHGKIGRDEDGKATLLNFTDLDGNSSLGLLRMAGIKTENVKYLNHGSYEEGRINIDTGGFHGAIILKDGKFTVVIDHHSDESGRDSSATKFTYELLASLGLLEKQASLDRLVDFVTQMDNKSFPGAEKYYKNCWRNLFGLGDMINFKHLVDYFKAGRQPYEVLSEKDLKKMGLFDASQKRKDVVEKSLARLEKARENGLVVDSARYGEILVDINKQIFAGFDAARHIGCQTYVGWSPAENGFFVSSVHPITDSFPQGKNIRGTMWLKPLLGGESLKVTLKEILSVLTDGKLKPTGELADFLAKEGLAPGVELPPAMREILKRFGQRFYDALKSDANWDGYDAAEQRATLDIQLRVFFRKQLAAMSIGQEAAESEINFLVKEIK